MPSHHLIHVKTFYIANLLKTGNSTLRKYHSHVVWFALLVTMRGELLKQATSFLHADAELGELLSEKVNLTAMGLAQIGELVQAAHDEMKEARVLELGEFGAFPHLKFAFQLFIFVWKLWGIIV